jgi:hypothetical protein
VEPKNIEQGMSKDEGSEANRQCKSQRKMRKGHPRRHWFWWLFPFFFVATTKYLTLRNSVFLVCSSAVPSPLHSQVNF